MLIAGLVLSAFGLGFFCWLLFTVAVYALPFLAGLTAGLTAFHSGSGFIGALIVGFLAGGATLALGQIAFAIARTSLIRIFIGLLYAVPATIAGYQLSFGLAGIGVLAGSWHEAFAAGGAVLAGITAFARLALYIPPSAGQRAVEGSTYSPVGLRPHDQRG
jgi:hypothetical protein